MASTSDTIARKVVPAILLGSLVFVAVLYLGTSNPDLFYSLKDSATGSSAMADAGDVSAQQAERDRYKRIDALLISDQNKRDLKEGRPFWNATPALVDLALATAADHISVSVKGSVSYEFHDYELIGGQRFVAEFQNSRLSCMHYAANGKSICETDKASYYTGTAYPFNAAAAER